MTGALFWGEAHLTAASPRFLGAADYPGGSTTRLTLLGTRTVGDVVLLRYAPKPRNAHAPEETHP